MKKRYKLLILLGLTLVISPVFAQNKIVKGTITDGDGEPLIGVNIIVKGTTLGTISDVEGNYTLSLPENLTLVTYSYIGFEVQEIDVTNRSVVDVQLLDEASTLSEVVVVGYTERDRRKLTSSVATVNSEKIERVPMATFDNILQGASPGVLVQSGNGQPGTAAKITIRGPKSFSFNETGGALYMLDGNQITAGDFAAINPNDIASVSILKDAAATSIYGSRGASGVVVITTKSGTKGATKIDYHAFFGVSPRPDYNDGLRPLTSAQLIDLQHEIGIGPTVGLPQEQLDELRSVNTNWLDATTRDATIQSHEINLSGGSETTTFYISAGYFSQEGTSLRSRLDRYSLRTKVNYTQGNFSIGSNLYLAHTDAEDSEGEGNRNPSNPFYTSIRNAPYNRIIDPVTGEYALPLSPGENQNIVERIATNDEDRTINQVVAGLNARYKMPFLEGLSAATQWGMSLSQRDNVDYLDPNSVSGQTVQGGQGSLFQSFTRRVRFTGTNSIHYDFTVGDDHAFNIGAYQEFIYFNGKSTNLEVFGLGKVETIAGGAQGTDDNGFIPSFGGGTSESALSSYFGTLDYSYIEKYLLSAGIRRDGSANFGKNNRFATFYSVGLGWIITEEAFLSSSSFVDYLKFRASYGTVGNDQTSLTDSRSTFDLTSYNGQNAIFEGIANPDLKWETTTKINLGVDATVLNNRLNINLDVYNEETTDLLLDVPLSLTTGFDEQRQNIGSLRNRGIELNLTTRNIDRNDFKWTTGFNIARNKTTVLELSNGEPIAVQGGDILLEEDKEFGLLHFVRRAGVNPANGLTLWYDLDGNLTEVFNEANAVDIAPSIPKYHGGVTNTFTYKDFQLRATFNFAQGHSIYNDATRSLYNPTKVSRGSVSTNALRFWRQPGDITDLPDPQKIGTYSNDSGSIEDASYVRLRNVLLSYDLPFPMIEKLKIAGLRIYAQGQNIHTWTAFTGLDPENSDTDYDADYPSLSTYTLGLDVKF
ncbi:MAG: SusC/RagA family TonB-linked outer membrane protein [Cyclobacteriaceae bacterium]